ncbi:type II secretion system protein [Candidatus Saccharibacteria bacterium]|nr:type II secretion system protein [Candidatus Saccharibacteria bacterium]
MARKGEMKIQKGFTIIETSLVIAIAGLIFLMVFVALPGLRAQQRDTERREAVTKTVREIKNYQSNNRGALPSGETGTFLDFYNNYLGGEDFMDPSGEEYKVFLTQCTATTLDSECTNRNLQSLSEATFPNDYSMYIVTEASCDGEKAVKSSNPRSYAVLYRLERSGVYCEND